MFEGYRVVTVTPAGRRRYMEILARYLLRDRGLIDWHEWWVNTDVPEDLEFMQRLCAMHPDFFRYVTVPSPMPPPHQRNFRICEWGPGTADPGTLYIRLDDDVVFIEEGALRDLLRFRLDHPEPFLVYPAIVNNAVMIHLYQRRGLLPKELPFCEYAAFGNGFRDSRFAESVHRQFLDALRQGALGQWRLGEWQLHCYERVCVNCISWFGRDFAEFGGKVGWDEEKFLSYDRPAQVKRPNVIYGKAIVAHFSYQHQNKRLDATELLSAYRAICDQQAPTLGIPSEFPPRQEAALTAMRPTQNRAQSDSMMKLVYASSPSHDRLRDDYFLKTLCEPWDPVEVRFDATGSGSYGSKDWKQIVVQRFGKFAEIAQENADRVVVFCDTDIQWLKPVQKLVREALEGAEIVFQREWHGRQEANVGFTAAKCTRRVIEFFRYIARTANSSLSDQDLVNQMIARGQMPCTYGYLPETFANDHLLPFVPLDDAVIYHSIRSLSSHAQEATVQVKARQHQFVQQQHRLPASERNFPGLDLLVERNLIFGRYSAPWTLEPLGIIKLGSNGQIIGGRNPNEAIWRAKDGALSFFHAEGFLTSTFDRNLEDDGTQIAVGPCFTHPVLHFLFPYRPLAWNS